MVLPKISKLSKSELQNLCEDRDIDSSDMDREQMMAELWKHEESVKSGEYEEQESVEILKLKLELEKERRKSAQLDEEKRREEMEF